VDTLAAEFRELAEQTALGGRLYPRKVQRIAPGAVTDYGTGHVFCDAFSDSCGRGKSSYNHQNNWMGATKVLDNLIDND
jgi:hypothetical protein